MLLEQKAEKFNFIQKATCFNTAEWENTEAALQTQAPGSVQIQRGASRRLGHSTRAAASAASGRNPHAGTGAQDRADRQELAGHRRRQTAPRSARRVRGKGCGVWCHTKR